jgi:hypothetical protein
MPAVGGRHRCVWRIARDERAEVRSQAPQHPIAYSSDCSAIEEFKRDADETNAILHVTC